jgi:WD40 repeat protein
MRRALRALLALVVFLLPLAAAQAQYQFGPNATSADFGKNKIQYRKFKWLVYHSPHFTVYYYETEVTSLQKMVSFAESAYDELSRSLNFQIKEPIPLIFYATHSAFEQNNVLLDFIDEATGAFAVPSRARMVLPIDLPDARLITIVRHELTHVFQFKMLYGGSLARALTSNLPSWFVEGMASYFGRDETSRDKMFLRDAVVNDRIPSIRSDGFSFFAYRYGHAVFEFIEERYGHEGLLDFLFEIRNTITGRVDRAVKRSFKLEAEDFDIEFRRWARKKFLTQLVVTGEPSDFGRVFRVHEQSGTENISPVASPSGELIAAFSAYRGKADVVLFDARKRTFIRNLTRSYSNRYQYLISQELQVGRGLGRDLAFSPDGNRIAVFAKRERGRSLILLDVLNGGINKIIDLPDIEQPLSPAWSPDGKRIAFSGWRDNNFDIFSLDIESKSIVNVTHDEIFDGAPAFSPDGKSLMFVSVVGTVGYAKVFRIELDHPEVRYQITTGESNENDPIYSFDGKRIYFTSDRATTPDHPGECENIYSLELATGELKRFTNVVTGAFMPTVIKEPAGEERIVFTGFWKGALDLYETTSAEPQAKETVVIAAGPAGKEEIPHFEPDIQVSIDPANQDKYHIRKFFLENAGTTFGIASDQTFLGEAFLSFTDYLGDHRITTELATVNGYSAFDLLYANLANRLQWQVRLFDERTYFLAQDFVGHIIQTKTAYQQTGAIASLIFPFNFYDRFEIGIGAERRKIGFPDQTQLPDGTVVPTIEVGADNFPLVEAALVGDSAVYSQDGPVSGRRWRLDSLYAPQVKDGGGTLYTSQTVDFRQYIPLTLRSNFAFRGWVGYADGSRPSPYYFGGLDTLRAFDLFSIIGDRAFFANFEFRFPIVDYLITPVIGFQSIRGNIFLDTGGAWFHKFQSFQYYNATTGMLQNGLADYGFGFSVDIFGLPLNWDFAKQWTIKSSGGFRTEFWVGQRF